MSTEGDLNGIQHFEKWNVSGSGGSRYRTILPDFHYRMHSSHTRTPHPSLVGCSQQYFPNSGGM